MTSNLTKALLILLVLPLAMAGGCVVVTVTDDATGSPVAWADVNCTLQPSGQTRSLGKTDDLGKLMVIPLMGMDKLMVSKTGYATFSGNFDDLRPRGNDIILEIRMSPTGSEPSGFPGRKPLEFDK